MMGLILAPLLLAAAVAVAADGDQQQQHQQGPPVAADQQQQRQGPLSERERIATVHALRDSIHRLPAGEAARRFAALPRRSAPPPRQDEIDHFVVLYMENQAMNRMFGCLEKEGLEGVRQMPPLHRPDGTLVNVSCGTGKYVCTKGGGFSLLDGFFRKGVDSSTYPYPPQSIANAAANGADGNAVEVFAPEQLPIKTRLAQTYGVFNKLYTASPTASWPNHMLTQSGTSCGLTVTGRNFDQGGGPTKSYPQFTVYDSMLLDNVSFGLYINSSCGLHAQPACKLPEEAYPLVDPFMAGVARHVDKFHSQATFYEQAAAGTLPAFSWFSPPWQACDHPCRDIAKGERLLKDVYESLRAGPKWNRTMFLLVYDDIGGYFDHVIPPSEGVPAPDAPCNEYNDGFPNKFDFRRLGGRSAAILMGGKVPNAVFQEPKHGPYNTSQFDLTSVAATVGKLFNLSTPLTRRSMWAGTFDELLLAEARPEAEMPWHLPQAPAPSEPWEQPTSGKNISYSFFFKGDTYTEWNTSTSSSQAVAPAGGGSVQRPYGKSAAPAAAFRGLPADLDAVVPHWNDHTSVYCFKGNQYWKFDTLGNSVESGYPAVYGNTSDFPGVPAGLDAAVSHPTDGKSIYFFKNSEYWKYDTAVGAVLHGYPKKYGGSTGLWPGIPDSVDAAMPHWDDGVSIFFFKGRQVYKYQLGQNVVEQGYPRPYGTGTEDFQGVPHNLSAGGFNRCGETGPPQFDAKACSSSSCCDGDEHDEGDRRRRLSRDGGGGGGGGDSARPQHCSATEATCRGPDVLNVKQERMISSYAELTGQPVPQGLRSLSPAQADRWLAQHWELWRSMGHPTN